MIALFALWSAQDVSAQQDSPIEKNWYHTYILDSSPDGFWIYYGNFFLDGTSTGHVKNIKTGESYSFSQGTGGKFSSDSKFFSMPLDSNTLVLQDLKNGFKHTIDNVMVHYFSYTGKHLITKSDKDTLTLSSLNNKKIFITGRNFEFKLNPQKDILVMANGSEGYQTLQLTDFESISPLVIMKGSSLSFPRMQWSENGEKLGFIYSKDNGKSFNIGVYDLNTRALKLMERDSILIEDLAVANIQIAISNSGERVYFQVLPQPQHPTEGSGPEVWDTFDKIIYPRKNFVNSGKQGPWQYVWFPSENRVFALGDTETSHTLFNPESEYALVFDAYAKEPQFSFDTFVDLYVLNMKSGEKKLAISKQFTASNYAQMSPDGKFLAYFNNNNWWLYDFKERRKINLSKNISHPLYNKDSPRADFPDPYGLAGWSKDGQSLYIYDEFDVWQVASNGQDLHRLTNGRETKREFRIVDSNKSIIYRELGFSTTVITDSLEVMLAAKDRYNLEMGYFLWKNNNLHQITWQDKRLTDLIKMSDDNFIFSQQSFTEPISIECANLKSKEFKRIFKSNPQWDQYKWPKRELIHYGTEVADSLNGVLIYPISYDNGKKYPMVVNTYEKQSFLYHEFSPPYVNSETGFNYLNYALDGYFVLLPDIHYKMDAPGISAAICIKKAVKTAVNLGSIDEKKIGLIGHSHGGYDTAFTITETDMFAAAVAGSGIFNLESFYFDIYKLAGLPEISRIENDIFHMQSSFFENPDAYRSNSTLHQAAKINTPLFMWAGKEDTNVNPNQSLQLYLALRRLRKPAKLFYYKGENHALNNEKNKEDLTIRIKAWFDRYLK